MQLKISRNWKPLHWRLDTKQQQKNKRNKMKTTAKLAIAALAFGVSAWAIVAQNTGEPAGNPDGPRGPGGMHRPPVPAVVRALDANHDGVVDADEIANAPAALKTLDKDGDGKLTIQELMGPRPQRGPGGGPGPDGEAPAGPPPGADQ
jgi:hypothetical protein